ncbi:hypothetical protein HUU53_02395 [Candidatus Micrarchaeota archaeon]|nr:hypothetical protein [Candidatus Micrarchaeota archaeon]
MPHKCVKCSKIYANQSKQLLNGCSCGSRIFLYLRDDQITLQEALDNGLKINNEIDLSEQPVDSKKYAWLQEELKELSKEQPVTIDYDAIENLRILEKGRYEIDVSSLMEGNALIVKDDQGVYYVQLPKGPTLKP